jgi:hypothetical protein
MTGISESLAGRAVIIETDTVSSAEIPGTPETATTAPRTSICSRVRQA